MGVKGCTACLSGLGLAATAALVLGGGPAPPRSDGETGRLAAGR
jgi:hypothetical protein